MNVVVRRARHVGSRRNRAHIPVLAVVMAATALAACGSASATERLVHRGGLGRGRRERVRQRGRADRRPVRPRRLRREQPEHRPAHLRGEPERGQRGQRAGLVIQNGVGYDTFMNKIESASPELEAKGHRRPATARAAGQTPPIPHLWYKPKTMPAAAKAMGNDLAALDPSHAAYFRANVATFDASLQPWLACHRRLQGQLRGGDRRPPPSRWPTTCSQAMGDRQPHAVPVPGGHHERRPTRPRRT